MSLTSAHLLAIAEAVAGLIDNTSIDWAIPSPFRFADKADFFAAYDNANDTKTEIETTLVNAAWLRYLTFEDIAGEDIDARSIDDPVRELVYEITLFNESNFARLDETVTPDAFNKQIKLTNHEHVTQVMELCDEFQGTTPIAALIGDFTVAETVSLAQIDNTEFTTCDFVPAIEGDQTKLECRIRVQIPC